MSFRLVCFVVLTLVAIPLTAQNRVSNGGFGSDTSAWTIDSRFTSFTAFQRVLTDSNGSATSGAAQIITSSHAPNEASYVYGSCIAVTPGESLSFSGRMLRPGGQQSQAGSGWIFLYWYREANCVSGSAAFGTGPEGATNEVDRWKTYSLDLTVPADARGARVGLIVGKFIMGNSYRMLFDDLTLGSNATAAAIGIEGPASVPQGIAATFRASATNCQAAEGGWNWGASGGTITATRNSSVSITWPSSGSFEVTATHGSCSGANGRLGVSVSAPAAAIVVSSLPNPILQLVGSGGQSESFTLTNSGSAATTVTIASNGSFFDVDRTSLTISPGESQALQVTGRTVAGGAYNGTVSVTGPGTGNGLSVPVTLLAVSAPVGTVQGVPSSRRPEISAPASTNSSGTMSFANNGTSTLEGVLSSDASWLTLSPARITVPPGGSAPLQFTTDRAKQSELGILAGSASATIQLRFARGSGSPNGKNASANPPAVGSTIVTMIDSRTLAPLAATAPPLGLGELAMNVPLLQLSGGRTDITVAGRLPSDVFGDLRLFLLGGTGAAGSQRLSVPPFSGRPQLFSNITRNFFPGTTTGSVQLRSTINASIVPVATHTSTVSGKATTEVLPVLRSDRAAGSEETVTLPALRKAADIATDVYLQEMSGNAAVVTLQYKSAAGVVVSTSTQNLLAFGNVSLADAVPAGAVQLTARTAGAGRVVPYALNRHSGGETALAIDWRRLYGGASTDTIVAPLAPSHGALGTQSLELLIANTSSSTVTTVTARFITSGRERPSRRGGTSEPPSRSWTIAPGNVRSVNLSAESLPVSEGHAVFAVSGGAPVLVLQSTSGGIVTAGVPLVPVSAAKALGDVQTVFLDDAPASAAIAGTFTHDLRVAEVDGAAVKMRVALTYTPRTAVRDAAAPTFTREFSIAAGQSLTIGDVVSALIGPKRAELGRLDSIRLTIQIVSGDGRIVSFLLQRDPTTTEVMVRPVQ